MVNIKPAHMRYHYVLPPPKKSDRVEKSEQKFYQFWACCHCTESSHRMILPEAFRCYRCQHPRCIRCPLTTVDLPPRKPKPQERKPEETNTKGTNNPENKIKEGSLKKNKSKVELNKVEQSNADDSKADGNKGSEVKIPEITIEECADSSRNS